MGSKSQADSEQKKRRNAQVWVPVDLPGIKVLKVFFIMAFLPSGRKGPALGFGGVHGRRAGGGVPT